METARKKAGFTIMFQAFQEKGASFSREYRWSRARKSSLASIPHKRAAMPYLGIPKKTKPSRRSMAEVFCRNVVVFFPRPLRILPMVVER